MARAGLVDLLAGHPQRGPAGHQHRQVGAGGQQPGDRRSGRQQVLEVVQHHQQPSLTQLLAQALVERLPSGLPHPEGSGQGRQHQRGRRPGPADEPRPSGNSPPSSAATWRARRVLPVPPTPVRVTRPWPWWTRLHPARARRRPTSGVGEPAGCRGDDSGQAVLPVGWLRPQPGPSPGWGPGRGWPVPGPCRGPARVNPELLGKRLLHPPVGSESLGLAARPVQGHQELAAGVPAAGGRATSASSPRSARMKAAPSSAWIRSSTAAKRLQPGDLPQAAGLQDHPAGQVGPSPQVQGLAQEPRAWAGSPSPAPPILAGQPLKAEKVQPPGEGRRGSRAVGCAAAHRPLALAGPALAPCGGWPHRPAARYGGGVRWILAPQLVYQPVGRHDLADVQE